MHEALTSNIVVSKRYFFHPKMSFIILMALVEKYLL